VRVSVCERACKPLVLARRQPVVSLRVRRLRAPHPRRRQGRTRMSTNLSPFRASGRYALTLSPTLTHDSRLNHDHLSANQSSARWPLGQSEHSRKASCQNLWYTYTKIWLCFVFRECWSDVGLEQNTWGEGDGLSVQVQVPGCWGERQVTWGALPPALRWRCVVNPIP